MIHEKNTVYKQIMSRSEKLSQTDMCTLQPLLTPNIADLLIDYSLHSIQQTDQNMKLNIDQ